MNRYLVFFPQSPHAMDGLKGLDISRKREISSQDLAGFITRMYPRDNARDFSYVGPLTRSLVDRMNLENRTNHHRQQADGTVVNVTPAIWKAAMVAEYPEKVET